MKNGKVLVLPSLGKGRQRGVQSTPGNGAIMETMGTFVIRTMTMTITMAINMTNEAVNKIPEKI